MPFLTKKLRAKDLYIYIYTRQVKLAWLVCWLGLLGLHAWVACLACLPGLLGLLVCLACLPGLLVSPACLV